MSYARNSDFAVIQCTLKSEKLTLVIVVTPKAGAIVQMLPSRSLKMVAMESLFMTEDRLP
jgi:hypothetical protein